MTDRELLERFFNFLAKRSYVTGDEESIHDMVLRYKQPPLTMYHQVCMQMTKKDYGDLDALLGDTVAHFSPENLPAEAWIPIEVVAHEPA